MNDEFLSNGGTLYTAVTEGYDKSPNLGKLENNTAHDLRRLPKGVKSDSESVIWNREQKILKPPMTGLWSVYMDGSFTPKIPLRPKVEKWLASADMALFQHPWRSCAYDEIDECVRVGKITAEQGEKARSHLMLEGFPKDFGLWACGIVVRRVHLNQIQIFAAPLWMQMVQKVPRDQIWLPYVLWKLKTSVKRIHTIEASIYTNKVFAFRRHGA
jgi:hypothetical protein